MAQINRKCWNEENIKNGIMEIVNKKTNSMMPTHSEMFKFYENYELSNAVRRHGGTNYWAKILNLKIKNCESKIGENYEIKCINDIFEKTNLESEKCPIRYPYDLLVEKKVKIDVKFSKDQDCHTFKMFSCNLEKKMQTCDIFVIYCIGEQSNKTYIIPACVLSGKTQFSVGIKTSKYDKFLDRWDIIKEYYNFMNKIN